MSAIDGIYFASTKKYIESLTTTEARIAGIDKCIDALLLVMIESADKEYISEYSLDDGQTKIRTAYRGVAQIAATIQALTKTRNLFVNRKMGRSFRLVDGGNFTGNNFYS